MKIDNAGSFPDLKGNEPDSTHYYSSLDNVEPPESPVVNLACPSCGEICVIDPSLFPVGDTGAVCSACEKQMALTKGLDGSISVRKIYFGEPADSTEPALPKPPGVAASPSDSPDREPAAVAFSGQDPNKSAPNIAAYSGQAATETDPVQQKMDAKKQTNGSKVAGTNGPTRPVVCPKCLGRYRVPVAKIPKNGAWVTCPSCAERFIVKLEDLSLTDSPPKSGLGTGFKKFGRKGSGHVHRLGIDTGGELEVTVLDPITPTARRYWSLGLIAVVLVIFGVEAAILRSSWRSANSMAELQQTTVQREAPVYDLNHLAGDLRYLQQRTLTATHLERSITHSGPESRIYKFAVAKLDPDACVEITKLEMNSRNPSSGMVLSGVCFNERQRALPLKISWNGRWADLNLEGQERLARLNVVLYQAPAEATPSRSDEAEYGLAAPENTLSAPENNLSESENSLFDQENTLYVRENNVDEPNNGVYARENNVDEPENTLYVRENNVDNP
ncbi:MAG: zinc-ribbon domain-containing protein [Deltaproteobacteria bacterium]|jgi:predicted Zn finger-like uncharacterized protein|nr:zinc-ribbon domain-containing protein [Deltaproteobacteria bacterium]